MDRSNVILNAVVGSTAYGMATPMSDKDELGVYVAPLTEVMGLNTQSVVTDSDHKANRPDGGPDYTLHEVGKYIGLALKCNPSILELLFLDEYLIQTELGRYLVANRSDFLSEPAIRGAYGAYAKAQADRLIRRNEEGKAGFSSDVALRTAKHARHCLRLLHQGAQLLRTGTMAVKVGPKVREYLFEAGEAAERNPQAFYTEYFEPVFKGFNEVDSNLPQHPNRDRANQILVMIRTLAEEARPTAPFMRSCELV